MKINNKSLSVIWFYIQSYRSKLSELRKGSEPIFPIHCINAQSQETLFDLESALKTELLTMLRYPTEDIKSLMSDISIFIESFSKFEVRVPVTKSTGSVTFNSILTIFSIHSLYHLLNNVPTSISTVSIISNCEEHLSKFQTLVVDALNHGEYYDEEFELSPDGSLIDFRNLNITYKQLYQLYCDLAGERVHLINSSTSMICYLNEQSQPDLFNKNEYFVG